MAPGERRIALWGAGRIRKIQGDSRQLVAGAYVILAAMWGSVGGIVIFIGIIVNATATRSPAGLLLIVVGIALVGVGLLRQVQSHHARKLDHG
jgi:hypothetical protein